ncbi:hypothetical protein [Streptomyces sp. NPDC102360]|uniref:hypothetical protein n=1 Tax=Streptomyces sp. NPDC102360 TaxID=3366160 RepID=UPI0038071F98
MQYVIIGLGSFLLTALVMAGVLARRLRRRKAARGTSAAEAVAPVSAGDAYATDAAERWAGPTPYDYSSTATAAVVPRRVRLVLVLASGGVVVVVGGAVLWASGASEDRPGGQFPTASATPSTRPTESGHGRTPPPSGDGKSSSGGTGATGGGDGDGYLPLLSADNLAAFGSAIGGMAAAAAVCVSMYQMRLSRSTAEAPPNEPPPSDGYL